MSIFKYFNQTTKLTSLKKHFIITISSIVLAIILSYYLVISGSNQEMKFSFTIALLSSLVGVFIAYVLFFVVKKLDKIFPWQTQTNNRLFLGFVVQFVIAVCLAIGFFYSYTKILNPEIDFFNEYRALLIKLSILVCIIMLIYSIVYFAFYSYYSFATLQIESVKQERKQIDLQLKALKSQLSPHFLFNSLNTISSLVFADNKKAQHFIRRLGKLYNYTLQSYHSKLITLKEELDFVASYQYLLAIRFEDKFKTNIQIETELLETKIPPLCLQMLVENAVKHNTMSVEKPLVIDIFKEGEFICVKNTITESPKEKTSFQVGLKNINKRYLLLINKGISISNGINFTVKIPIIR